MTEPSRQGKEFVVAIVAGEESGDQLGAELMAALNTLVGGLPTAARVRYMGTGGARMAAQGLPSLFPLSDIAVMGVGAVIGRLPLILRRLRQCSDAIVAARPDCVVIIDSPDFTHRVARRVRKHLGAVPIINYVCPSVWAWRPGRARKMRAYVDHVMAILPFEPEAVEDLGGPPCTYVGHPVAQIAASMRDGFDGDARPSDHPPRLVVLPGSRTSEISRLLPVFGETLKRLKAGGLTFDTVVPAVEHLRGEIEQAVAQWPVAARIVTTERQKWAAFFTARAALAASGTVTLELAMAGVPMVVAYKLGVLERSLKWMAQVDTIVLANLILGTRPVPEFIDQACTPDALAAALQPLLSSGPEHAAQAQAFHRLQQIVSAPTQSPAVLAARIVFDHMVKQGNDAPALRV